VICVFKLEVEYDMLEALRDPIYIETKEILSSQKIDAVLFDLDDTLIFTSEIFYQCQTQFSTVVCEQTGLDPEELFKTLSRIDFEELKCGVSPQRWPSVLEKTAKCYPEAEKAILGNLALIENIYDVVPRMKPGSKTFLDTLGDIGIKRGLITHANVDWTYRKLEATGLVDYFEAIVIADENGSKTKKDWKTAMELLAVEPENCLIIGDSIVSDMIPGDELGAKTVWVKGGWGSKYTKATVPERTIMATGIGEVLAALAQVR
jgi:putative hydrolase of the HAD superfamily